jgi:hypothetical protein
MVPNPISDIGMFSPSLVLRYGREEEEEHSRDALVLLRLPPPPPRIDDDVVAGIERARGAGDMRDAVCVFARARVKRLKNSRENRNKNSARCSQ